MIFFCLRNAMQVSKSRKENIKPWALNRASADLISADADTTQSGAGRGVPSNGQVTTCPSLFLWGAKGIPPPVKEPEAMLGSDHLGAGQPEVIEGSEHMGAGQPEVILGSEHMGAGQPEVIEGSEHRGQDLGPSSDLQCDRKQVNLLQGLVSLLHSHHKSTSSRPEHACTRTRPDTVSRTTQRASLLLPVSTPPWGEVVQGRLLANLVQPWVRASNSRHLGSPRV